MVMAIDRKKLWVMDSMYIVYVVKDMDKYLMITIDYM